MEKINRLYRMVHGSMDSLFFASTTTTVEPNDATKCEMNIGDEKYRAQSNALMTHLLAKNNYQDSDNHDYAHNDSDDDEDEAEIDDDDDDDNNNNNNYEIETNSGDRVADDTISCHSDFGYSLEYRTIKLTSHNNSIISINNTSINNINNNNNNNDNINRRQNLRQLQRRLSRSCNSLSVTLADPNDTTNRAESNRAISETNEQIEHKNDNNNNKNNWYKGSLGNLLLGKKLVKNTTKKCDTKSKRARSATTTSPLVYDATATATAATTITTTNNNNKNNTTTTTTTTSTTIGTQANIDDTSSASTAAQVKIHSIKDLVETLIYQLQVMERAQTRLESQNRRLTHALSVCEQKVALAERETELYRQKVSLLEREADMCRCETAPPDE